MKGHFEYSLKLVAFILRRERVVSALWLLGLALFSVGLAPGLQGMFSTGDAESAASLVMMLENPSMVAMLGPSFVDVSDGFPTGPMYVNFMFLWVAMAVGVMNIFLVTRHTRSDEDYGRLEVVRSLPVGRLANLNATMIAALIINGILALLTGLGIAAMGVEGMDLAGSILYGTALGVLGLFFAAVTALFCQLSSSSRGAAGFSGLVIGVVYMLRAMGDMDSSMEALSWLSPMGLVQRSKIYIDNLWWPSLVTFALTIIITAIAYRLCASRDMGQGLIPAKPGRAQAKKSLLSAFGLSRRLLRNTVIAWFSTLFIIGAMYGTMLGNDDFEGFIEGNEFYGQLMMIDGGLQFSMEKMFISMCGFIMSFMATVAVITAAMKPRSEEKEGRCEHILSRSVSRTKYLACYAAIAYATSILMQLATVLGIYGVSVSALADKPELGITFRYVFEVNMVFLPAMWVMIGVAVLLVGALPKAAAAVWGYYGVSFFFVFISRLPDVLPEWTAKLTPFGFIPQLPVDEIEPLPLIALTVIALALTGAGIAAYRKRDMLTV